MVVPGLGKRIHRLTAVIESLHILSLGFQIRKNTSLVPAIIWVETERARTCSIVNKDADHQDIGLKVGVEQVENAFPGRLGSYPKVGLVVPHEEPRCFHLCLLYDGLSVTEHALLDLRPWLNELIKSIRGGELFKTFKAFKSFDGLRLCDVPMPVCGWDFRIAKSPQDRVSFTRLERFERAKRSNILNGPFDLISFAKTGYPKNFLMFSPGVFS
jgi:hypothetical protein